MHPSVWKKPPFSMTLFLRHYAKTRLNEYSEAMNKILDDTMPVVELTKMFVKFMDDDGKPHRFDIQTYSEILPSPLNQLYIAQLNNILSTLPDGRDKILVESMHKELIENAS